MNGKFATSFAKAIMLLLLCPSLFLSLLLFLPLSFAYLLAIPLPGNTFLFLSLSFSSFSSAAFHHSSLPLFFHPQPLSLFPSFPSLGSVTLERMAFTFSSFLHGKSLLHSNQKGRPSRWKRVALSLSLFLTIRYTATVKNSFCNSLNPRSTCNLPRLLFRQVSDDEAISIGSLFCPRVSSPSLLFFLFRTTPHFAFNPSHFSLSIPSFLLSFLPPFRSFCCTVTNLFFRQRERIEWIKRKREKGGGRRL